MNEQKQTTQNQDQAVTLQEKPKEPLIVIVAVLLILLIFLGGYFLTNKKKAKTASINSFEACKKAGYPILQSMPEQCSVPGGQTFTNPTEKLLPLITTALDVKITPSVSPNHSGEGVIEFATVEESNSARLVGIKGVGTFCVDSQTKIYDKNNEQVAFSYLKKDQKVAVKGEPSEGCLHAIEIKVQK